MAAYLCDVNIWLSLAIPEHIHHSAVRAWFDPLEEPRRAYFCRSTHHSFLRLVTTHAVLAPYRGRAFTNREAWSLYDTFLRDERVSFRPEPSGLETAWRRFAERATASPKLWMDSYLAAFAIADGCTLVTSDAAFRQFRGLDLMVIGGQAR